MPTAATLLRGMSRIDRNHRTTPFLCLVHDKALELGKRPAMKPAAGFGSFLDLRPLAYIRQVLKHDGVTLFHRLNNLLRENVITVSPEAGLFPPQLFQVPFGRPSSLLLE